MLARLLRLLPLDTVEGYEHPELVAEIFAKTVSAKPVGDWPAIRGTETVLDFGGACGIHYKLALTEQPMIRWAVVETAAMVQEASKLATERLRFFDNVQSAVDWLGHVDLVHSSGALQYAPQPLETAKRLANIGAPRMEWRRLFLSDLPVREMQRSMMIENGPAFRFSTKAVVYERQSLSRKEFEELHSNYRVEASGSDWFDFVRRPRRDRA